MTTFVKKATWLDLERAQLLDPSVVSLVFLDIAMAWDTSIPERLEPDINFPQVPEYSTRYFRLQLLECRRSDGSSNWRFLQDIILGSIRSKRSMLGVTPSRHGRIVRNSQQGTLAGRIDQRDENADQVDTIAFTFVDDKVQAVALSHLRDKEIIYSLMEFYSGALFLSYKARAQEGLETAETVEFAMEYYD